MDTTNSIFSNNDIHNCEGEGISLEGDTGNTIRDNYVHDNPRTAENPEFDPSGIGIGVGSGSTWENPHTDNNRIINNTVVRNHRGIIAGGQRFSNLISNYIANNDYAGVIVGTDGDADLSNNQIVNNSGFGVKCEGGSDMDVTFSGNMISGNGNNCDSCPNCLEPRSTCGTITKSTQLTSDLVNDSTCITFGADNITLDCQGHSISWCCSGYPGSYSAIYAEGRKNIGVRNCVIKGYPGSISGYSHAIYLKSTSDSSVNNNTMYNFTFSSGIDYPGVILLENSPRNVISNNTLYNHTSIPIYLVSSQNNSIQDNIMYNGTSGSVTIGDESDGNSILRNTIRNSNGGISLLSSSYNRMESNSISNNKRGIYLQSWSNSNMILSNRISNVSDPYGEGAVGLVDSSNNTVRNNTIYNTTFYGINILDASYKNFIFNNTITKTFTGINMSTSAGLCNNTISNTTISNTTYGVYLDTPYNASVVNSTITNNVYGIYSSYAMSNSLVRNNNISSNTNTGVYIKESDLNFSLNTVTLNGQYGVFCNTTFLKPTFSGNTISGNGNNCDGCTGCP